MAKKFTLNTDYTRFSYQDFLEDFYARLRNDERFAKISSASIYGMLMEMIASSTDMTNYFIQRTAEEGFIDTCKLLSSAIKHGHNLGYNPVRSKPAEADIKITIKGPLPDTLKAGATVYFAQDETNLSLNGHKFILSTDYSYTFDPNDIAEGVGNSAWSKTLLYSKNQADMHYRKIEGIKYWKSSDVKPIKAFQGEFKTTQINGFSNARKVGKNYQYYIIDDLKFSNWYAQRDPNAYEGTTYTPRYGFTKVGIGPTEDIALGDNYLYTIEEDSIYVNKDVINADMSEQNFSPLKVCRMFTNPDKTVGLQFGDGKIVSNGLNNTKDNIFVRYFITDGKEANTPGTDGALFSIDNNFYATQENGIIDITSNIQFTTTGDIYGGEDFETLESIKINAPISYAANKKLITMNDFVAFFKTLTSPIKVKNAIAYGQGTIEKLDEEKITTYKRLQNNIIYCLTGSPYNINGKLNSYINVLNDEYYNGAFTLYGNGKDYIKRICDLVKLTLSNQVLDEQQYAEEPSSAWQQNINKVRAKIEDKMMVNTKVYSMPPIIHYYDVVGDVEVSSLSKLQDYKTKVENEIYKWLDSTNNFNNKIYKSDFIKFFTDQAETKGVDLNIRVSELEKADNFELVFNKNTLCLSEPNDDNPYDNFSELFYFNPNMPGITSEEDIDINKCWNVLFLPKLDKDNKIITAGMFKDKQLAIDIRFKFKNSDKYYNSKINAMPHQVSETSDSIMLAFFGYQTLKYDVVENNVTVTKEINNLNEIECGPTGRIVISLPNESDFVSTSSFSENNTLSYNLSKDKIKEIEQYIIKEWLSKANKLEVADRAIDLPYYVRAFNVNTRTETISRLGIIQSPELKDELTEHSFWNYLVPYIIKTYYTTSFTDLSSDDIQESLWDYVENLVYDLYALLKPVLSDSILDDNNNIINYSLPNELAIIRLNIKYKYRV